MFDENTPDGGGDPRGPVQDTHHQRYNTACSYYSPINITADKNI